LLTILLAEGITFYALYRGGSWNLLAIILTIVLVVGAMLLPILNTVTKLYADFKQKQGYMLFLTPQNGYRIIWAKTIYGAIETLVAFALVAGCLMLSGFAADQFQHGVLTELLRGMQQELGNDALSDLLPIFALIAVLQMIAQLSIAMLAVTVSRAFMSTNSYGWLIALLMYIAFAIGVNMVNSLLLLIFGFAGDIMQMISNNAMNIGGFLVKYFAIGSIAYIAWFVGCTMLSGCLVKRGVDL
jgi:hypothetical protein